MSGIPFSPPDGSEDSPTDLRTHVLENLINAIEGGYGELLFMSAEDIADDMFAYAPDMDGFDRDEVIKVLKTWLETGWSLETLKSLKS